MIFMLYFSLHEKVTLKSQFRDKLEPCTVPICENLGLKYFNKETWGNKDHIV